MSKAIYRITQERIENGVVTSGRIASAEKWAHAYRNILGDVWQRDVLIAALLMHEMECTFDGCCETPEGLATEEDRLAAIKQLLGTMGDHAFDSEELQRLLKYEEEIRSGKYADELDDEDE